MKISKILHFVSAKMIIAFKERRIRMCGKTFKYMLFNCKSSDLLIVVFSSCTKAGVRAKYHYLHTLKHIKANKLYILDDKARDHRGGYYIGSNMEFEDERIVNTIIDLCINSTGSKRLCFVGSSKGGYAALNFGLERDRSIMIVGAPQYRLGSYLNNIIGDKETLKYIVGDSLLEDNIDRINHHLETKILSSKHNDKTVFFHYSINDETYQDHVKPLLDDINKTSINLFCDVGDYNSHSQLGAFFPKFLVEKAQSLI